MLVGVDSGKEKPKLILFQKFKKSDILHARFMKQLKPFSNNHSPMFYMLYCWEDQSIKLKPMKLPLSNFLWFSLILWLPQEGHDQSRDGKLVVHSITCFWFGPTIF